MAPFFCVLGLEVWQGVSMLEQVRPVGYKQNGRVPIAHF